MRVFRIAFYGLSFCAALLACLWLIRALLDAGEIEPLATRHEVARHYRNNVNGVLWRTDRHGLFEVVYLGDSMVVNFPPEHQLPLTLEETIHDIHRRRPRIRVYNFGRLGTGVFDYYFMADVICNATPDLVILPFNLANTAPAWQAAFSRPELGGWMRDERVFDALWLPIHHAGLTTDRLLYYTAIIRAGGFGRWIRFSEQQTRMGEAKLAIQRRIARLKSARQSPEDKIEFARFTRRQRERAIPRKKRYTAAGIRYLMAPALAGLEPSHPTLAILGETVRSFRRQGIEVLVYIDPINYEHIDGLGLLDASRLDRTLRSAEEVVVEASGQFIDLHDILSDAHFKDATGHFRHEGEFNGSAALSARLAPLVIQLAERKARERRSLR